MKNKKTCPSCGKKSKKHINTSVAGWFILKCKKCGTGIEAY